MSAINLQSVIYREAEHYVAQCLNVDVSSFGNTEAEALHNLREALELYFEDMPGRKQIPRGTFRSILRQSGLAESAFKRQ